MKVKNQASKPHFFPPYGRMIKEWEDDIDGKPPSDWLGNADWSTWRDGMSTLLSHVLWPRFDKPTQSWIGPAVETMRRLTLADFELLKVLRPRLDQNTNPPVKPMLQKDLFILEDVKTDPQTGVKLSDRGPDLSLRKYLEDVLESSKLDELVGNFLAGVGAKAGNVDLEMKQDMQRPRAYQVAVLLEQDWFTHQDARTAVTPSMISGHCVETLMGGVANYYRAEQLTVPAAALANMAQHTVDVGDRRVLAGVHYPSDNISSWLTGLLLCAQVCPDTRGRAWVWDAITNHSEVYKAVVAASAKGSPYRLPLQLLGRIGRGEIDTLDAAMKFALASSKS
jgi:hypothetical protein